MKSPAMSLKGWNIKDWVLGNYSTIKEVLKVGIPATAGWFATGNPTYTTVITVGGKLLLDTLEYWYKER